MPRKVDRTTYELFDARPDLEFDYYLTEKLGWRSVDAMRRGLPAAEYHEWKIYLARKAQQRQLRNG